MKKIVLMLAMVVVCFSAGAALEERLWESQILFLGSAVLGGEVEGVTGLGWYAEVFNVTDNGGLLFSAPSDVSSAFSTPALDISLGEPGVSPSQGWYDGLGYILNIAVFGTATDLDNVQFILYNNVDKNAASYYIASSSLALPDAPEIAGADDVKVTFDFTGQTWQAIPEPATVLLFGIGGMGAWLLRRRQQA